LTLDDKINIPDKLRCGVTAAAAAVDKTFRRYFILK
jgi:hypothetical protein